MSIRPIETVYKGYRFRSRLEARWAVFFDSLGIRWEYKKKGYDLGHGLKYLPDFFLPDIGSRTTEGGGLWVEVKGDENIGTSEKLEKLVGNTKTPGALLVGPVSNDRDEGRYEYRWFEFEQEDDVSWDNYMMWMKCYECGRMKYEFLESSYMKCEVCDSRCDDEHPDIAKAVTTARSARFEFGQEGA